MATSPTFANAPPQLLSIVQKYVPPSLSRQRFYQSTTQAELTALETGQLQVSTSATLDAKYCNSKPGTVGVQVAGLVGAGAKFDPEPISKTILSIGAAIAGAIFGKHAKKVATEITTACGITDQIDSLIVQTDNAVATGAMSKNDAISTLQAAYVQTQTVFQNAGLLKSTNIVGVIGNEESGLLQQFQELIDYRQMVLYNRGTVGVPTGYKWGLAGVAVLAGIILIGRLAR